MNSRIFDDKELDLFCPKCETTVTKTILWIKNNSLFVCSNCGCHIELNKENFTNEISEIEGSIDNLLETFKQ